MGFYLKPDLTLGEFRSGSFASLLSGAGTDLPERRDGYEILSVFARSSFLVLVHSLGSLMLFVINFILLYPFLLESVRVCSLTVNPWVLS